MRLIDADALKEWIDEYVSVFKKSDNKDIKGYIEHQPTIEPKRGEWIISYADDYGIKKTECSACGESFITYDVYGWEYCPWCGASMRERDGE